MIVEDQTSRVSHSTSIDRIYVPTIYDTYRFNLGLIQKLISFCLYTFLYFEPEIAEIIGWNVSPWIIIYSFLSPSFAIQKRGLWRLNISISNIRYFGFEIKKSVTLYGVNKVSQDPVPIFMNVTFFGR